MITDIRSRFIEFSDSEIDSAVSGSLLIHRVFPFDRFIDLLRTQRLALVKPKLWEDPYENPLNRKILNLETGTTVSLPHLDDLLFAQCWSLHSESDAMWRIYSPDKRGVLVTVEAGELVREGKPKFGQAEILYLGKVQYKSQAELTRLLQSEDFLLSVFTAGMYSGDGLRALLYKRDSFQHEQEIRLIMHRHISEVPGNIAFVQIPIPDIIKTVTLDPRLSESDFDRSRYLIRSAGYAGKLVKSELYSVPDLKLSIPSLSRLWDKRKTPTQGDCQ